MESGHGAIGSSFRADHSSAEATVASVGTESAATRRRLMKVNKVRKIDIVEGKAF